MHPYTLAQLRDPAAYAADPELATLARRVARTTWVAGAMSRGEWTAAHLAGEHAESVLAALEAQSKADVQRQRLIDGIRLPEGWRHIVDGDVLLLSGPRIDSLPPRLRRLGGEWLPEQRCWKIPLIKAASLSRVLGNALAHASAPEVVAEKARKAAAAARAELERWLGYVEESAAQGRVYDRGVDECRTRGIDQHPDLAARLAAAVQRGRTAYAATALERWLGFVEDAATQGRVYDRGVNECRARGIDQHPALAARLAAAIARGQSAEAARSQQVAARDLFAMSCLPPLRNPTRRLAKQVVVYTTFGTPFRIDDEAPSIHGSHLLGHEGEQGCYAYYRDATPEEIAALEHREREAQAEAARAQARAAEIQALAALFESTGERPDGMHDVVGEVYCDSWTIYGGGARFVLTDEDAWYLRNNGADGDAWAHNNIRTGGAGAIGWRLPRSPELAARIQNLGAKR